MVSILEEKYSLDGPGNEIGDEEVEEVADTLDVRRNDAFADTRHWIDTGCDVSPSCLTCWLPRCKYDVPGGVKAILLASRNDEIFLLHDLGHTTESISEKFGISKRSVFRVLNKKPDPS